MDKLQFISGLVHDLAWPIAAGGIAAAFQRPIRALLGRATSAEGFGTKLTFADKIDALQQVADEAQTATERNGAVPTAFEDANAPPSPIRELTDELSATSAVGAVIGAWAELEQGLRHIDKQHGHDRSIGHVQRILDDLSYLELLPADLKGTVLELRRLRNTVAHAREGAITLEAARTYRATAQSILETVRANSEAKLRY